MAINKQHPDYPEYIKRCQELRNQSIAEEEREKAKYSNQRAPDLTARMRIREVLRKYSVELKKLQEEYAYLFTDDVE